MSNVTIAIPPFPSQDLAKLVLGYLAEEQLMTAYDEFLQASPYLDALRNEYDRIFMTSLKNILAEYRAVKIYVETCKPFILRRKLFQCTNLLEIVKFLVNNVDINKLHVQEANVEKTGHIRHLSSKSCVLCDVCNSLKLTNCTCTISQSTSKIEATSLEGSVETTLLEDLPGNTSYGKKVAKETEAKNYTSNSQLSITSSDQIKDGSSESLVQCSRNLSSTSDGNSAVENIISSITENKIPNSPSLLYKGNDLELRLRIQGVNDDLNLVNRNRNDTICRQLDCDNSENVGAETLQDFSTESGGSNKVTVPDSSTSENIVQQTAASENDSVTNSKNIGKRKTRQPPLLIRVSNDPKNLSVQPNTLQSLPRLASKDQCVKSTNTKSEEDNSTPKITILSDVKVDDIKMPPLLKTATSASLVQMQTLYINGTPAYKNTQQVNQAFTKDEIMAMPTIILVPASDKNKKIVPSVTQNNMLNNSPAAVSCSTKCQPLEPLVIDVSSNEATSCEIQKTDSAITDNSLIKNDKPHSEDGLIKTVDVVPVSHASLPKDNNLGGLKTSTPHILPPTRKSSSTPRRTSHVRVLDFTTPRRILHETLNEEEVNQCHQPSNEITVTKDINPSPIVIHNPEEVLPKVNNNLCIDSSCKTNSDSQGVAIKENKASIKLYNWDAELRALAYMGNGNIEKLDSERTTKPKKNKKKASPAKKSNNRSHSKTENKKTCKSKETKKGVSKDTKTIKVSVEKTETDTDTVKSVDVVMEKPAVPVVKPTINIISRKKWTEPVESEKIQNKSSNSDGNIDTPELERISLQNEIGAKLNISDLLETPYKQALYDIQMETPKFLGPDIPGDPLSDVKIMNIPTPRFLNTPKLSQNTPSSYSSRPTDYSSGGSYYKPDDQDYILPKEILEDVLSASTGTFTTNTEPKASGVEKVISDKVCEGKSRPVRQCTKNVSYNYATPINSKMKDLEERMEKSSTCSENGNNKCKVSSTDKNNVLRKKRESRNKSKKTKSPMKTETPKAFMKIKPRRTTPVKEVLGKGRKKTYDLSHTGCIKTQSKKLMVSKEKNFNVSPVPIATVATKSRRKSSTPRKLHCTKKNNPENSPDPKKQISQSSEPQITNINSFPAQESDNEQQPLRWSDQGSQETKAKMTAEKGQVSESEDITRIKEYIQTTVPSCMASNNEGEGTLQVDLIKRGFDVETARMIERDLLETPTLNSTNVKICVQNLSQSIPSPIAHDSKNEPALKKSDKSTESDSSTSNNLQIVQENNDDDDKDEPDFSVYECNKDTCNYFEYKYDEAQFTPSDQVKLKETFTMEICVEDDVEIRLCATALSMVFEHDSNSEDVVQDCEEKIIEKPTSPLHYNTLYTPRKAQCYEIFDSTLASLDTPLKPDTTNAPEFETVTEIVLEVEKLESDIKAKPETKKRKRVQSGASDESPTSRKKVKPDTSYLLNSAGIQNIDIESVLSKLHGP